MCVCLDQLLWCVRCWRLAFVGGHSRRGCELIPYCRSSLQGCVMVGVMFFLSSDLEWRSLATRWNSPKWNQQKGDYEVRTYVCTPRAALPLWSWWYSSLDTFRNGEKGRVNGWIQSTVEENTIEFETELQRRKMTEKRDVYRWSLLIFTGLYTFFFAGKDWPCMFSS